MFLNIRILLVALLFFPMVGMAQQPQTTSETSTENFRPVGKKRGSILLGPYVPIAIGDNFVSEGMDLKGGAQFQMKVLIKQKFYVGPAMSIFWAKVTDPELVGHYESTTNFTIGVMTGYETQLQRFDLAMGVGVGFSGYFNQGLGDKFNDRGTALWFRPEISYRLANYISVFAAPEYRHDFMSIEVPQELESTFGGVDYLNISFGLRINLGSGYKFQ